MHNPLALLTPDLLTSLIASGHKYFVRQTYRRGFNHFANLKEVFLISAYREFTEVNAHFQAIRFDQRKYIYQLDQSGEREKLFTAAGQPEGYRVFVALLKDKVWKPSPQLGQKITNYLRSYTKWKPQHGVKIDVNLYIQFGELFLNLRYLNEQLKVPLTEIEKI